MKKSITPSRVEGRVQAPPSKSMTQRAIAAALLVEGRSEVRNPSSCEDAQAASRIAEGLGAEITRRPGVLSIKGGFQPATGELDCGESGLCLRLFSPIAALASSAIRLDGRGSLKGRPVGMMEKPLTELGVRCSTVNGFPPVSVEGPLQGGEVEVDGSLSSQFVSGLLMALPLARNSSILTVRGLTSRAYVDLTINVLKTFGVRVSNDRHERFDVEGQQSYSPSVIAVEGDWSGAAFFLVAGAIAGCVEVTDLELQSLPPDRRILEALAASGARLGFDSGVVRVEGGNLRAFSFDASDSPDLFPPLAVLASRCPGTSRLSGVRRLRFKESDRASVLAKELAGLGIDIRIDGDGLDIRGGNFAGGTVDPHRDHRIAMAGAIAALTAEAQVEIRDSECVSKSYPDFFEDLKKIGAKIHE
jgi:3-phosphoshikimate 1-carboxyvinyltransferase